MIISGSNSGSLVLQGVGRERAGNYTCGGTNSEGQGISEPVNLNIMCKVSI